MNEIVNKFLLAGDKFMPEMHLKQPGFSDPKYDGYLLLDIYMNIFYGGLASIYMVYKFFDKSCKGSGINNEIKQK